MNSPQTLALVQHDAELHAEVTKWHSENRLWADEVEIWRNQHEEALRALAEFERRFLHEFRELADRHGAELAAHERRLTRHEHAFVEHLEAKSDVAYDSLVQDHQLAAQQHSQQRQHHEKTKARYVSMMERKKLLQQALAKHEH